MKRKRMIFDLPPEVQMAIRLRGIKTRQTTGMVVEEAVRSCLSKEMEEAKGILAERELKSGTVNE